jgi:hypothetical protein
MHAHTAVFRPSAAAIGRPIDFFKPRFSCPVIWHIACCTQQTCAGPLPVVVLPSAAVLQVKSLAQSCTRASRNTVYWWFQVASFTVRLLASLCVIGTSLSIMMWFGAVGGWLVMCWMMVTPSEWHPTSQQAEWVFHWVVSSSWLANRLCACVGYLSPC